MIVGVDIKASIGTEDDSGWSIGESLDAKTKRQREHLVLGVRIPLSHLDSLCSLIPSVFLPVQILCCSNDGVPVSHMKDLD